MNAIERAAKEMSFYAFNKGATINPLPSDVAAAILRKHFGNPRQPTGVAVMTHQTDLRQLRELLVLADAMANELRIAAMQAYIGAKIDIQRLEALATTYAAARQSQEKANAR